MAKQKPFLSLKLSNTDQVTLIDEEDYLLISKYTWRLKKSAYVSYVCATKAEGDKRITLRLHRIIMNPQSNEDVHHINEDPLDNRKSNLECLPKDQHRGHPKDYFHNPF
jgi:hypothetical protein